MAFSTCRHFYPIRHLVRCVHNMHTKFTHEHTNTNAFVVFHIFMACDEPSEHTMPVQRSHVLAKMCTGVRNCYYLLLNLTIYSFWCAECGISYGWWDSFWGDRSHNAFAHTHTYAGELYLWLFLWVPSANSMKNRMTLLIVFAAIVAVACVMSSSSSSSSTE